jgi:hypothetical protein
MVGNERKVTYTGVMTTATALASALLLLQSSKANAAPGTGTINIPPELLELLIAMAADISDIDVVRLPEILEGLKAIAINVRGWPENGDFISSFRTQLLVANVGIQMEDLEVPDGFELMVKADPGNPVPPAVIRVASSQADSQNPNSSYPLIQNEFRSVKIKNAKQLYVSASAVPAWVICSVERRQ